MDKRKTLIKLRELRAWKELEEGFPDQRARLSWAAKVEPLLKFNIGYQVRFSTNLQTLHGNNVSVYMTDMTPALTEMITILEMAIEELNHELEAEAPLPPLKLSDPLGDYVHQDRITNLRAMKSKDYDFTKLVGFCNELNSCRTEGNLCSIIMLCRAIIDHVPPIFGVSSFNEVVNNYPGTKSFKELMERLNSTSRKIADQHLHTPIRANETLPTITQVDFSNELDVLLSEIIRIMSTRP